MRSDIINRLLFDYEELDEAEMQGMLGELPAKILRWLGAHHPDNRTRKLFFLATNISIGEGSVINGGFVVSDDFRPLLTIGRRVAISPDVKIICASSPNNSNLLRIPGFKRSFVRSAPVAIDDDVWVGTGAIILPGVRIHQQAVVGAGAVVTKSVPEGVVVTGCPAKIAGSVRRGGSGEGPRPAGAGGPEDGLRQG